MRPRRPLARSPALVPPDAAQTIHGTVTEPTTREPVPTVMISVRDARGELRGAAFSGADGSFSLGAYLPTRAVRAVELYREPAFAPPRFRRGFVEGCAGLLVWTTLSPGE